MFTFMCHSVGHSVFSLKVELVTCHNLLLVCSEIEDTILLALQSPEVYDDIARGTRCKFETNRPRAVLFEGPPGLPRKNYQVEVIKSKYILLHLLVALLLD